MVKYLQLTVLQEFVGKTCAVAILMHMAHKNLQSCANIITFEYLSVLHVL